MLCPWCMHYGAEDAEYTFDSELYCGICAQQLPRSQDDWAIAYREMDPSWYEHVERELNHIISSRSGLPPEMREAIGRAIDAYRDKRVGTTPLPITEEEYANWYKFACTYFAPSGTMVQP
jgi:hypothetical protein